MILKARSSSAAWSAQHNRPSLIPILCIGAILSGCMTARAQVINRPAVAEITFEQHKVVTGTTKRQTILPGFFLGGSTAELVMVYVDENDDRRLQMYEFDGDAWVSILDATLSSEVMFVDVAKIGGRDRLITYAPGRFGWFDPDSGTVRPMVEIEMDYNPRHDHKGSPMQPGGNPPHVDITRDLNGDGRDDLLVPDFDGFWVSIQMKDGSFTEAVKLGPPEPFLDELVGNLNPDGGNSDDSHTFRDVGLTAATLPLYLGRVHEMDYDQDGRGDLVFWNEDHFDVHLQDENGLFATLAETYVPHVQFDSDGIYSHTFVFRDQGVASFLFGIGKKTKGTVLHSLSDLNGDGVADLVTLTLSGRGINRQRSVYEVHFGASTSGATVFTQDVGAVIRPRGKGGAMQPWGYSTQRFEDLDSDGQFESLFREVTVGLGGIARALVGNSVPINLEIYRMEDGMYPDKPAFTSKIRRFAPFAGWGNVFFPPVLMGDVNGDGRADLLVGENPKELHVFLGVPGPNLFVRKPRKFAVALPADERNIWLTDLNRDGKQDILVHHTSGTETHGVTMLIAR